MKIEWAETFVVNQSFEYCQWPFSKPANNRSLDLYWRGLLTVTITLAYWKLFRSFSVFNLSNLLNSCNISFWKYEYGWPMSTRFPVLNHRYSKRVNYEDWPNAQKSSRHNKTHPLGKLLFVRVHIYFSLKFICSPFANIISKSNSLSLSVVLLCSEVSCHAICTFDSTIRERWWVGKNFT